MLNVLVSGGAGNVGSSTVAALLKDRDVRVVVVDDLSTGTLSKLSPHQEDPLYRFVKCDVNTYNDIAPVMLSTRFDYVFHYAAVVGVQRTLANPISVLRDIDGIRNVLELAKSTGVKRIFYSSSSEVYGEPVEVPQNEERTPLNSRLPYAIVKNLGESYLRSYWQEHALSYTVFRLFNTYGPNQSTDFVVARFLEQACAEQPLTIYGDGSQTRTFCHIEDHIATTMSIFRKGLFVNECVNVGNDEEVTVLELARMVKEITGSPSEIVHLPALKDGDMRRRRPCLEKMRRALDRPLISIAEGIRRLYEAQKEQTPHSLTR